MTTFKLSLAKVLKVALPVIVAGFLGLLYVQSQITFPNGIDQAGLLTMFGNTTEMPQEAYKAINVITGAISLPTIYWVLGIAKQLTTSGESAQRQEQLAQTNQVNMSVIDQQQKINSSGIALLGEIVLAGLEANPTIVASDPQKVDLLRSKFSAFLTEANRLSNVYVSADAVPEEKRAEIMRNVLDTLIELAKQGATIGNQDIINAVTNLSKTITSPQPVSRKKKA